MVPQLIAAAGLLGIYSNAQGQDLSVNSTSGEQTNFTSGTNNYNNAFIGTYPASYSNSVRVVGSDTLLSINQIVRIGSADNSNNSLIIADGGTFNASQAWLDGSGNSITVSGGVMNISNSSGYSSIRIGSSDTNSINSTADT
jgi:hypothetical protein